MKRSLLVFAISCSLFAIPSCKEGTSNDGKTLVIQDSISNIFPTCQALHINVEGDKSVMVVVIGDLTFYKASPEEKSKKAAELGKMILRIYGKDNHLDKGMLVVTNDLYNTSDEPKDGIVTPMDFSELKKR